MAPRKIADKLIQKVEVRLDGKNWPLLVDHNVLIECEELTGLNMLTGEAGMMRPSAKAVRALLYLCIKRAGAKYTLQQVGKLITPHNIVKITEGLLAAWAASMPERDEEEGEDDPTKAAE
jgi:hypothetical protein